MPDQIRLAFATPAQVEVPEWYTRGQLPSAAPPPPPAFAVTPEGRAELLVDGFRVVEGELN